MFPRQIETLATQHIHELRSRPRTVARRPDTRPLRTHAGWTLIAVGLRLASPASR